MSYSLQDKVVNGKKCFISTYTMATREQASTLHELLSVLSLLLKTAIIYLKGPDSEMLSKPRRECCSYPNYNIRTISRDEPCAALLCFHLKETNGQVKNKLKRLSKQATGMRTFG